jgi:hypothetical protein
VSFKSSGTYLRRSGGGKPPQANGGTQVFPVPPRASENGARGPAGSADTPAVSVLATVGVGGPPSAAAQQPPRPLRRTTPTRDANEPTRIFVMPPGPSAGGDAATVEMGRQTATFASPPFTPVPTVIRTRAPQPAGSSIVLAVAKPEVDAIHHAPATAAPLLRAFDDVRARVTTWATAKTITAPVAEVAQAAADAERKAAKARTGALDAGRLEPRRRSLGPLSRLRRSSPATRKLSVLLLAMTAVVSGGSFVGRTLAKKRVVGGSVSAAPAAPGPPARVEPSAAPLPQPAPRIEVATAAVATVEAASAEAPPAGVPVLEVAPAEVARDNTAATPDSTAPHERTLARRAVDALIAGDRATALQHYRELSRKEPERRAYREAVRLLAPAPSDADALDRPFPGKP